MAIVYSAADGSSRPDTERRLSQLCIVHDAAEFIDGRDFVVDFPSCGIFQNYHSAIVSNLQDIVCRHTV
jgi:hypothetical protein